MSRAPEALLGLFALGMVAACSSPKAAPPAPAPIPPEPTASSHEKPFLSASQLVCRTDADCRFDPRTAACGNEPGFNPQAPIVDQGVLCYCEGVACTTLRVWPVPCESDDSCAVRLTPRPHPVATSRTDAHQRGKPCADYRYSTTCERTNICTMHRHDCP